jgi:DNA-binding transcriptional regulator YiaG
MVSELEMEYLRVLERSALDKDKAATTFSEIESLIGLIRQGNPFSLAKARRQLGVTPSELSALIGISEDTLNAWEIEQDTPSQKFLISWRLKLGSFMEQKMASYLRTTDPELIHQFWEILWKLNDL